MIKVSVVALCVVLGLAACGSTSIDPSASEELQAQVESVRQAAASGDEAAAQDALAELIEEVRDLRSSGEIDEAKAREISGAVEDVDAALAAAAQEEAILNDEDDLDDEESHEDDGEDEDTKKSKPDKPTKGHTEDTG